MSNLDCNELMFLQPNTTSEIQPCDQRIIKPSYLKNIVKSLIHVVIKISSRFCQYSLQFYKTLVN